MDSSAASEILSDIIIYTKYARFLENEKRRESWDELCNRNRDMHIKKFPQLKDEITDVYDKFVRTKKLLPSMRTMQFAGKPIEINPTRAYNCSYLSISCPEAFAEVMFLLLGGTGVGYSVQKHHVRMLPRILGQIKHKNRKMRRYLIGDSLEGWSDAIKVLVDSFFSGKTEVYFDFSDIRPKGTRLVTAGGKAPGPAPLRKCLAQIQSVFENALQERGMGTQLLPIECHDICCFIADAVLSGGIRRSAMISLFSKDDEEMLYCKSGAWWDLNPQRARANNSAVFLRGITKKKDFRDFWEIVKNSGSGEPGIFFTKDVNIGVNPCVSGDTHVITKIGSFPISVLVDKTIEIWNGYEWSTVTPKITGYNQPMLEISLIGDHDFRASIKCTYYHKFYLNNGTQVEAKDLKIDDEIPAYDVVINSDHKLTITGAKIASIQKTKTESVVYCVNEPKRNMVVFNGILTGNCAEISLRDCQFCVAGDTKIITRDGIGNIRDLVGKDVEIWNGSEWSRVKPFATGMNELYRVYFSDGSHLDATAYHRFLVKDRFEKEYRIATTKEILDSLSTLKYKISVPRSNFSDFNFGSNNEHSYAYGVILGDGSIKGTVATAPFFFNSGKMCVYEHLKKYFRHEYKTSEKIVCSFQGLDLSLMKKLKNQNDGLPSEVFSWNKESILNFIAGWADTDGSRASNGIRIYGNEKNIRDGQLLLTKIGINSSVNLMAEAGEFTNMGMRLNDVWYLQITKTDEIPCLRLSCNNNKEAKAKGKSQIIAKIEKLDGIYETYCLTEPKKNTCVFNNVLTMQCNLADINASTIESQEDFNERTRAAAIIGTLQASYTDFHYLRDIWRENCEKDALLGISMTGIASGNVLGLNLTEAANIAVETNKEWAEKLGINPAARITTGKPSGTTSLVLGCSSGVHAWHDEFYIRRIRLNKDEPIYKYLKKKLPKLIEDEKFNPHHTAVLSIPQRAPDGAILRGESPIDLLERVKKIHSEWILPGHIDGANTHNQSVTVSIKDDEWDTVGEWMWENRDIYTGISVLPYDGGTYVQAPFESCSEEVYNELSQYLKQVDLTEIIEEEDNTTLTAELACSGGACEIH